MDELLKELEFNCICLGYQKLMDDIYRDGKQSSCVNQYQDRINLIRDELLKTNYNHV